MGSLPVGSYSPAGPGWLDFPGNVGDDCGDVGAEQAVRAISHEHDHSDDQGNFGRFDAPIVFEKTQLRSPPFVIG